MGRALALVLLLGAMQGSIPPPRQCELARENDTRWKGRCGAMLGESRPVMTLTVESSIKTGAWRGDAKPSHAFTGQIAGRIQGQLTEIEVELYDGRSGVIRTPVGWYPITNVVESQTSLRFRVDDAKLVSGSELDRAILERAASMLSTETAWARSDDRPCAPGAASWSIYCAIERASGELAGGFHNRRPALQVVRAIVDERTVSRSYSDRLIGYNNDPATTHAEIVSLFKEAIGRIGK